MTYEEFCSLLWEKQSLKGVWNKHEIRLLFARGHIYVESFPSNLLEVFPSLPIAFDQYCLEESQTTLGKIIDESDSTNWQKDAFFFKVALLDPLLIAGPTQLHRSSITRGKEREDSSLEYDCLRRMELSQSILYNLLLGDSVFHTLEFWRLKEMLENHCIFLKFPDAWHDQWEGFMFKQLEGPARDTFLHKFGISCWTARDESEGIWNNYVRGCAPCCHGSVASQRIDSNPFCTQRVKIQTTVADLLYTLGSRLKIGMPWNRIGRVRYHDEFELRSFANQAWEQFGLETTKGHISHALLQSLFMKRQQYDYEQEVRLVVFSPDENKQSANGFFLECEPQRFIHEVVVNPDCSIEDFNAIKKELEKYGLDRVVLSRLATRNERRIR